LQFDCSILDDSKKLTAEKRTLARNVICRDALAWGIGWANHEEIDRINILQASLLAMERAFQQMLECKSLKEYLMQNCTLPIRIEVITDGLHVPDIKSLPLSLPESRQQRPDISVKAMVKADAQIPQVMAASILAKTERDALMVQYAKTWPEYGFEKHKGYPTKAHRAAILKYGCSPIQRKSFTVKPF
jgi:ribonuclease HII